MTKIERVYVVSDLHFGGERGGNGQRGFQLNTGLLQTLNWHCKNRHFRI
jgi:hypothetical protein